MDYCFQMISKNKYSQVVQDFCLFIASGTAIEGNEGVVAEAEK
jgi:hypothetical protein